LLWVAELSRVLGMLLTAHSIQFVNNGIPAAGQACLKGATIWYFVGFRSNSRGGQSLSSIASDRVAFACAAAWL